MKKIISTTLVLVMLFSAVSCAKNKTEDNITQTENEPQTSDYQEKEDEYIENTVKIVLSDDGITVNGEPIPTDESADVYAAHDIVYYHDGQDFTYGEGDEKDAHSADEADAHTVVHIAKAGVYEISGKLSCGQIAVDLGDDAKADPEAVVTLVLDNADITCTVAPAVIFYNVYECSDFIGQTGCGFSAGISGGAGIVLADGSVNTLNGSYVAKIYKSVTLSEDGSEVVDSKKLHKYDGTLYSKMTMTICGEEKGDGVLNVNAENEGIDSEMHLVIYGGNINIVSGDDGINTNEDGVSQTLVYGGTVHIRVDGKQGEGDGIDSNGSVTICGGTVIAEACATSGDSGLDSDSGIHLNGGTVAASGNMYDAIDDSEQNYIVFTFATQQRGGKTYSLKNADGAEILSVSPTNAFTYLVVSSPELTEGEYSLECDGEKMAVSTGNSVGMPVQGGMGRPDGMGEPPEMPDGMGEPPEMPDGMGEPPEIPDGMGEPPEMTDGMSEPPQMPDGMGEPPERPSGMEEPPERPDGQHGGFYFSETSESFTINNGGNFITVIG